MDIINDEVVSHPVALSEKYAVFNTANVSYTNKKYKEQETESTKLFGLF